MSKLRQLDIILPYKNKNMKFKYFLSLFLMITMFAFAWAGEALETDNIVDNQEVVAVLQAVQCDQPMVSTAMTSVDNDVGSLDDLNVRFFAGPEDTMPEEAVPPDLSAINSDFGGYFMSETKQIQNELTNSNGNFNYEASDGDGVVLPEETVTVGAENVTIQASSNDDVLWRLPENTVADLNPAMITTALVNAYTARGGNDMMTK